MNGKPTIVLVHGSFADSSGWNDVVRSLHQGGYTVHGISNPLRGVRSDAEYLDAFLDTVDGPIVLVGHSYGGAVITNTKHAPDKVKALVYIAGFALDEGESPGEATGLGGETVDLSQVVVVRPFPGAAQGDGDAYLNPELFPQVFCQDLPEEQGRIMAALQRPSALASLLEPSGPPAWRSAASWYMIATQDRVIPPSAERVMAARAGAKTIEIDSSHVPMISHPDKVTELILEAAVSAGSLVAH
jgi:pimeloyl-ACP methyl ester carboxylesterase